jgi:hypothetical protein
MRSLHRVGRQLRVLFSVGFDVASRVTCAAYIGLKQSLPFIQILCIALDGAGPAWCAEGRCARQKAGLLPTTLRIASLYLRCTSQFFSFYLVTAGVL